MEEGVVTDGAALVCESEAALSDRVIEALDGGEAAVGERFVDEAPKMFGRLELGTVGGLEYKTNAVAVTQDICEHAYHDGSDTG